MTVSRLSALSHPPLSTLMPIPHFCDWYNCEISFEINSYKFFDFVPLFQYYFGDSVLLAIP
jgi:hypothetical protein